ncbi:MAG TPA: hypothetical protein ENF77_02050 [Candidatus Acetothermia bacterium]|nr:hypothetical protein [Candidatus Acetothermia bacterium]
MRSAIVSVILVLGLGVGAWAGVGLWASTFVPMPGQKVTLRAVGAPQGATFLWDLNGDGIADRTTASPEITWMVPQGPHVVSLTVERGGRVIGRASAQVVADPHIAAYREITETDGRLEVRVVVTARSRIVAPALTETMPPGWAIVVYDPGEAQYKIKGGLQALWAMELLPGDSVSLTYDLVPVSGGGGSLTLSGEVTAYVGDTYYRVPLAGIVSFGS